MSYAKEIVRFFCFVFFMFFYVQLRAFDIMSQDRENPSHAEKSVAYVGCRLDLELIHTSSITDDDRRQKSIQSAVHADALQYHEPVGISRIVLSQKKQKVSADEVKQSLYSVLVMSRESMRMFDLYQKPQLVTQAKNEVPNAIPMCPMNPTMPCRCALRNSSIADRKVDTLEKNNKVVLKYVPGNDPVSKK